MKKIWPVISLILFCLLLIQIPVLAKTNSFPYFEQFNDPKSGWEVASGKGWRTNYSHGAYEISLSKKDIIHAADAPVKVPESYCVETRAGLISGDGAYGLYFNTKGETGYLFIVSSASQNYMVLGAKPDNKWEVLKDKSSTDDLEDGFNTLKVEVIRGEASLYINGHMQVQVPVTAGNNDMGAGVVAYSYSDDALVHFDSFAATNLVNSIRESRDPKTVTTIDFSSKDQGFSETEYFKIQRGMMSFTGGREQKTWLNLFSPETSTNCSVAVKLKWNGGEEDTAFGLVFRYKNVDDFYYFKITRDGYYKLVKSVETGWKDLVTWKETDLLHDGFNTIKVVCRGPAIRCFLNEHLVIEIQDDPSDGDKASVGVGADSGVKCSFDDFSLSAATAQDESLDLDTLQTVDFSSKDQGFPETEYFKIQKGVMSFNGGKEEKTWMNLFSQDVSVNCSVVVKVKWNGGEEDTAFGLIFRYKNIDDFYYFKITGDGYYKLAKSVASGWENLVSWQETDLIHDGFNTLKVICRGPAIQCYLNDKQVIDIEDDPSDGDQASVGVGADSGVKCSFDDFSVSSEDIVAI